MANIFSLNVDNFTKKQVLGKISEFLADGRQHWIATVNPEIALKARKDKEYCDILNKADLRVADGMGIILASLFFGERLRERITGVDLIYDILADLNRPAVLRDGNPRVMIIGAENNSREKAEEKLKKLFSSVELGISLLSMKFNKENNGEIRKNNKENREMLAELNREIGKFAPDILFVAFGAPRQEQWICDNLPFLTSVKLAIGVGGAIDMISGKLPRAPKIIRKIGMEWLWRLWLEPRRVGRVFNAIIIFPYLAIKYRLKN